MYIMLFCAYRCHIVVVHLSIDSIWLETESLPWVIESLLMLLIETCDYFHIFTGDLDVCVHRQSCIIKDWHPTVAVPFCEPQLLCTLRTASLKLQGKCEVKGRLCIYHLPPIQGDVTLVQMFTLFFYFSSSWALSTHWREAGTWDLKVMNSIALEFL